MERQAYVVEASLTLADGTDPAAVGAAVTTELCGHWEHEGGCRWPHNNAVAPDGETGRWSFRTVFVAPEGEEAEVRSRIEQALHAGSAWSVEETRARDLRPDEAALAERLARTPEP